MNTERRKEINEKRLVELEPEFSIKIKFVLQYLESQNWQPFIASAFRSLSEQQKKVESGVSKTMKSKHIRTTPDGRPAAEAVDIVDSRWLWNMPVEFFADYLSDMKKICADLELTWGGLWTKSFPPNGDWAHIEVKG